MQPNPMAQIPLMMIGGMVFTDLSNLIVLYASFNGATNGHSVMRRQTGVSGYQVPVGKTLYLSAIEIDISTVSAAGKCMYVGYGDNDIGMSQAADPTNAVYFGDGSTNQGHLSMQTVGRNQAMVDFQVPAQKYLFINNAATAAVGTIRAYGYVR
jgi:hypothetical protein